LKVSFKLICVTERLTRQKVTEVNNMCQYKGLLNYILALSY